MEFEWKIFPGFRTAAILKDTQNKMVELQCDPADFKDTIIFISMFNDIEWEARENERLSWGLDPRKSGAERTMAYQVDVGRRQRRKCCGTLRNLVILYAFAPERWKEDN